MTRSKIPIVPLVAALMLAVAPMAYSATTSNAATSSATKAKTAKVKQAAPAPVVVEEKVVYHINDSAVARVAMRNVQNHIGAAPDAKVVVVTHGKGIDFLLTGAKDEKGEGFETQVAGLKEKGVEFRVCRNTLKGRNLGDDAVIMDAQVVPSGVAEIGRLQAKEGYVYLKP